MSGVRRDELRASRPGHSNDRVYSRRQVYRPRQRSVFSADYFSLLQLLHPDVAWLSVLLIWDIFGNGPVVLKSWYEGSDIPLLWGSLVFEERIRSTEGFWLASSKTRCVLGIWQSWSKFVLVECELRLIKFITIQFQRECCFMAKTGRKCPSHCA